LSETAYAAVDLGAESGRVVVGGVGDGGVELRVAHRFANAPVRLPDGLHWNVLELFAQTLSGLQMAAATASLAGVGIDAWGVDYGLFDCRRRLLGIPFHYRDSRTDGIVAKAHRRLSREALYEVAGIQTMPINTVYQLLAEELPAAVDRIALIPDLFACWLCGELANEITAASTTGLLDARLGVWARGAAAQLGLPRAPFAIDPVEPGETLGPVLAEHPAAGVPVRSVAGHDTASAFVATPISGPRAAILSSGTWSLLGFELDEPLLTPAACALNLSNERGIDGTTRLLANVMGLWLVQECRRHWSSQGREYEYAELLALAGAVSAPVPLFDPDDPRLLAPGDMPARITEICRETGQRRPQDAGQLIRSILASLACKYRLVLERLERVTRRDAEVVHVIGGGARNELLCRLTAATLGRTVIAGPVEATALGNVLIQARAAGQLGSLSEIRELVAESSELRVFELGTGDESAREDYGRFLAVTGLTADPGVELVA
jgi:rhamnulokinase